MQLRFIEQIVRDFKSFEGEHTLRWDTPGVTFFCGENKRSKRLAGNGAGKSSWLEALCWCLFGQTPGGLRNPDIMPWSGSGKPSVTERLEVDGKEHTIRRTASPNQLYLDNVETSQERLEEFLGMNLDLFTNTLLLAQGQPLFFDRTPKDKMVLFADTLQLERWDTRTKAATDAASKAEDEQFSLLADKAANEASAEELQTVLDGTKKRAEEWIIEQRVRVREATKRIATLQADFDARDKVLGAALLAEDGAATEHAAIGREARKLSNEMTELKREINRLQATADAALEQCERELKSLDRAKVCPTCGQTIKAKDMTEHKAHLETKLSQLVESSENAIPAKTLKLEETLKKRSIVLLADEADFKEKLDHAQTTVRRLQPEVATLKAQLAELRRVAKEDEANPHTAQIATLQGRLKTLKKDNEELAKALGGAGRAVECNKFWAKGFKDIKLQLIADVLDELELATQSMLEEAGLLGWEVFYSIERETKSGTIQRALNVEVSSPSSEGRRVKWESWSGGEGQRLRIVGALALADVLLNYAGVECNLEILDEPTTHMSKAGADDLISLLTERANTTGKSIIFCDHLAQESSKFVSVITVVKGKNGSYIE